jgi:hypothetical protein
VQHDELNIIDAAAQQRDGGAGDCGVLGRLNINGLSEQGFAVEQGEQHPSPSFHYYVSVRGELPNLPSARQHGRDESQPGHNLIHERVAEDTTERQDCPGSSASLHYLCRHGRL